MDWKQEYIKHTQPHPFLSFMRVWHGGGDRWVAFEIPTHWELHTGIHLAAIQNMNPGDGAGSAALDWLLDLADRHGLPVDGYIERLGTSGLSHLELRRWYKRHGFHVNRRGKITYQPGSRDHAAA